MLFNDNFCSVVALTFDIYSGGEIFCVNFYALKIIINDWGIGY